MSSPQWLETRPSRQQCPVCKAGISREKVIPLYGRGSSSQEDPRYRPRPSSSSSCVSGALIDWFVCDNPPQAENSPPASGTENRAREQRRRGENHQSSGPSQRASCSTLMLMLSSSCLPPDVSGFRGHRLPHVLRHRRLPLRLLHHSLQH